MKRIALVLLCLVRGSWGSCDWTKAPGCDELLTVDPRASFSRDGKDKCRLVKNYYYCLLREAHCEDRELTGKINAYMDSMKLVCRGLNGDRDEFQNGCRELEMVKCESHLQRKISDLMTQKPEGDYALCTALHWSGQCMLLNASCDHGFVEMTLAETKVRLLGEHACSGAIYGAGGLFSVSTTLIWFLLRYAGKT